MAKKSIFSFVEPSHRYTQNGFKERLFIVFVRMTKNVGTTIGRPRIRYNMQITIVIELNHL
ncbi:MAG: hypothetical protein PHD14_01160 [Dehalococcoidales bacterium]|nr:hypothetical protein [Dehalococcoidales bacterium]